MENFLTYLDYLKSEKNYTDYLKTKIIEAAEEGLRFIYIDKNVIPSESDLKLFCKNYGFEYELVGKFEEQFYDKGYLNDKSQMCYPLKLVGYHIYF